MGKTKRRKTKKSSTILTVESPPSEESPLRAIPSENFTETILEILPPTTTPAYILQSIVNGIHGADSSRIIGIYSEYSEARTQLISWKKTTSWIGNGMVSKLIMNAEADENAEHCVYATELHEFPEKCPWK